MRLDLEAARDQVLHRTGTGVQGVDAITRRAMEVMVMVSGIFVSFLASRLVAHRLSWQRHPGDEFLVQQCGNLPIHRREVQRRDRFAGSRKDLGRAERLPAALKRVQHGLALAGISFHVPILLQINLQ